MSGKAGLDPFSANLIRFIAATIRFAFIIIIRKNTNVFLLDVSVIYDIESSMQVKNLSNIVKYQANAVVSSEIIKKETGTVTVFAFDKGQGLSEHTAPFDVLVNVIDGQAEVTISGSPFKVSEGEIIIMPANKPHSLKAVEKFKMLLVMIKK